MGSVSIRNPIVLAAGTCGTMGEIADAINLRRVGAITTKSITVEPREGNPPHRIADLPIGMLNAIGLANEGIEAFLTTHAPKACDLNTTVIGSIAGGTIDEYTRLAAAMDAADGIDLIEVNVSCPNTDDGRHFGDNPDSLRELLTAVKAATNATPMIAKLSAAPGDIRPHAAAAIDAGADALTLINTYPAMAIDITTRKPRLTRGMGGLSGPAIHPIAVRVVREVHRDVAASAGVPIIGTGGVMSWTDAAEFILAGASAIGIGTALFVDPTIAIHVESGLRRWVADQGCQSVSELVGGLR